MLFFPASPKRSSLPSGVSRGGGAPQGAIHYGSAIRFQTAAGAFRRANKRSSSEAVAHQKMRDAHLRQPSACSFAAI